MLPKLVNFGAEYYSECYLGPVVALWCDGEDKRSVVETAHSGFDLHVRLLHVVVQGTEQVNVKIF